MRQQPPLPGRPTPLPLRSLRHPWRRKAEGARAASSAFGSRQPRTSGGAPPVPDQLVDAIDRLHTDKLANPVIRPVASFLTGSYHTRPSLICRTALRRAAVTRT